MDSIFAMDLFGNVECHVTGRERSKLVCEMERYGLDVVSTGFGTKHLNQGWSLSYSTVPTGVGTLTSPQLESFLVNEMVTFKRFQDSRRKTLTVVCVCIK